MNGDGWGTSHFHGGSRLATVLESFDNLHLALGWFRWWFERVTRKSNRLLAAR